MHTEDLVVDYDREGKEVEHVGEVVPYVRVSVFTGALRVKAVRLCDTAGFVVAADKMNSVWVA
jgi:hypothetical protein